MRCEGTASSGSRPVVSVTSSRAPGAWPSLSRKSLTQKIVALALVA